MQELHRILVVVDREKLPRDDVRKAVLLARRHSAHVELFLCEAEQAYVLDHDYDREGIARARAECVAQALAYLHELRAAAAPAEVEVSIAAECESPLFTAIVRKVKRTSPDLVIKPAAGADAGASSRLDPNDWQLMRSCPATLMVTRGKVWQPRPQFLAAIDVGAEETAGLPEQLLQSANTLAQASHGAVDVLYGEPGNAGSARSHLERLSSLCSDRGIASEHLHVVYGPPDLSLPAFLKRYDCDVVVLGALSHHTDGAALVGTLTSRLLEAVDSDFLLVRPPDSSQRSDRLRQRTASSPTATR
jgi:universal stress protein E